MNFIFTVSSLLRGSLCFALITCFYVVSSSSSESSPADAELVCSSTDSNDCYPQIFQPTINFQKIRDGQSIPPGLHIRLNIYTGEKEARLNIPLVEDTIADKDVQAVSTERAIITLDQPIQPKKSDQKPAEKRSKSEQSSSEDKVPIPSSQTELSNFQKSLLKLKSREATFDQALDDLTSLSHDIYYGREIIQDDAVFETLICLTFGLAPTDNKIPEIQADRERKAASVLISALQNNPAAQKGAEKNIQALIYPLCGADQAQQIKGKNNFVDYFRKSVEQNKDASTLKAKVMTLSKLLKVDLFRDFFLKSSGMKILLTIFLKRGEEFHGVRRKIGELLMDNFLDESLGAQYHLWPINARSSRSSCEEDRNIFEDGCWEHHIEEFSYKFPTEDWTKQVLLALKIRRPKETTQKSEL